jgi:hypothetical protein
LILHYIVANHAEEILTYDPELTYLVEKLDLITVQALVQLIDRVVDEKVRRITRGRNDDLLDSDAVCKHLGISRRKLGYMIQEREIVPIKVGRRNMFSRESIESFKRQNVGRMKGAKR